MKWQIYLVQFLPCYYVVILYFLNPLTGCLLCFDFFGVGVCMWVCMRSSSGIWESFHHYFRSWFCVLFLKFNYFFKYDLYIKEHMICAQLSKFLQSGNTHLIIAKLRKLNVSRTYRVPLYPLQFATTLLNITMILTFKTIDHFWLFGTVYNLNYIEVTLLFSFVQCYVYEIHMCYCT